MSLKKPNYFSKDTYTIEQYNYKLSGQQSYSHNFTSCSCSTILLHSLIDIPYPEAMFHLTMPNTFMLKLLSNELYYDVDNIHQTLSSSQLTSCEWPAHSSFSTQNNQLPHTITIYTKQIKPMRREKHPYNCATVLPGKYYRAPI